MPEPLRVLVVDDEPTTAAAHGGYVARVTGFELVDAVGTVRDALRVLAREHVDLVLLDLNLPDGHGLDIVRVIRGAARPVDVLTITAAREAELVRGAVTLGIVGYLLKPFSFADLRERLTAYRKYRDGLAGLGSAGQSQVDAMLWDLHRPPPADATAVKGLSRELLDQVVAALRDAGDAEHGGSAEHAGSADAAGGMSASRVGGLVGVSRVTARRYLQHLCDAGLAERTQRLGGSGRPEILFRWR